MKSENKGFTLIEILAAVTILGILTMVSIASVNKVIEKSKQKHYLAAEKQMSNAGQEYIRNNRKELPRQVGEKNKIKLRELVDKHYIEQIKDYSSNDCNPDKSYVQIYKYNNGKYSYYSHLVCDKYDTSVEKPAKPKIEINVALSSQKKYQAKFNIHDDNVIASYNYTIYRNEEEVYNLGNQILDSRDGIIDVNKTKDISKYTPGKIKIFVTATNILGNSSMKVFEKEYADNKAPKCIINPEDIAEKEWINNGKRVITVGCDDEEGSGCKREKYSKEFEETAQYGYIRIEDKSGNKTDCKVSVNIDKTAPSCVSSGGSNNWTKNNVTIVGTCKDNGSGCKIDQVKKTYDKTINTIESPGYVEDGVGNRVLCPSQVIKIDKEKPQISEFNNSGKNKWTNQDVTISANVADKYSGIKNIYYMYNNDTKKYEDWNSKIGNAHKYSINKKWTKEMNNKIKIVVEDAAGNQSIVDNNYIKIDKTKPTASMKELTSNWNKNNYSITASARDISNNGIMSGLKMFKIRTGEGQWENVSGTSINKTWWYDAPGAIQLYAVDNAGNEYLNSNAGVVKIDNTPPICRTEVSTSEWTNKDVIIKGICSDAGSGCKEASTGDIVINTTKDGSVSPGNVYDNMGHSTKCPEVQVRVDKTPPTIDYVKLTPNTWTKENVTLEANAHDNNSQMAAIYYTTNPKGTESSLVNIGKDYGTYTWKSEINTDVYVVAEDKAGNRTEPKLVGKVMIDRTAPTCSIKASTKADSNNKYSKKTTFKIEKSDDKQMKSFGIKNIAGVEYNGKENLGPLAVGSHTIYGYVKDSAGNIGSCSLKVSIKSQYRCDKGTLEGNKCITPAEYRTVSEYQHIWYCAKPGGNTCPNPPGTKDKWEWVDVQKYICPDGFQHLDGQNKNERCWKAAISE